MSKNTLTLWAVTGEVTDTDCGSNVQPGMYLATNEVREAGKNGQREGY